MKNSCAAKFHRHHFCGFTLIELLVAMSILAVVAVLGWVGLDSILRSRGMLTSELRQARGMQLTFAQLQNDCEKISTSMAVGGRNTLSTEAERLTLVRSVQIDGQPTHLQVITYRLVDTALVRHETASTRNLQELDKMWRAAIDDPKEGTSGVVILSGVSEMTLRLWNHKTMTWDSPVSRVTNFPTAEMTAPAGLELSLTLNGRTGAMVKAILIGAI